MSASTPSAVSKRLSGLTAIERPRTGYRSTKPFKLMMLFVFGPYPGSLPRLRDARVMPRLGPIMGKPCDLQGFPLAGHKPDSVSGGHLSRPPLARRLERCTRFLGGPRRRNLLHLAPDGVWRAAVSPRRWWALTPPFHPYRRRLRRVFRRRRSPFCATFRRLSPPGVSPASCPSVSGLSSDRLLGAGPRSPGLHSEL
jgi:hypothetical protein